MANGQLFNPVLNETKVTLGRNCPWTIFLQNFTRVQAAMHNKIVQQCSAPLMKFSGFRRSLGRQNQIIALVPTDAKPDLSAGLQTVQPGPRGTPIVRKLST